MLRATIRDPRGQLLSEAEYEYLLLPRDRFQRLAGIDGLPDHYNRHFGLI